MTTDTELFENSGLQDNPLNEFSGCHEHIVVNFENLKSMLKRIREQPGSGEIRKLAKQQLVFFKEVVMEHHAEEEQELFVAVMESAEKGEEANEARRAIKRLVAEHRELELTWGKLQADIKRLAKGKSAELDVELAKELAERYLAHAAYEEQYFLPMAANILSKNEMSALGLALHMRHQDEDSVGNYI